MSSRSNILKNLDDFIAVSRKNMKMALAVGDNFFIIEKKPDGKAEIMGHGHIAPRLRHGWWEVKRMPHGINSYVDWNLFVDQEQNPDEYKDGFSPLFFLIDQQKIFISKTNNSKTIYTQKEK